MPNGIYHVRFSSSVGGSGEGLVVIKQGSVNGGDVACLYVGQIVMNGEVLSGRLNVKRWNPDQVSVFGPLDDFELQLSGKTTAAGNSFTASGSITSQPGLTIAIAGRFLSAAA